MVWYLALQTLTLISFLLDMLVAIVWNKFYFPSSRSGLADIMIGMMERLLTLLRSIIDFFVDADI